VVREAWRPTRAIARALEVRFVLFQCPASFAPTDSNLASLRGFSSWALRDGLRLGFEPRGPSG
jgi:uncharacterized protein YecE (DUF72 family)